VVPSIPYWNIGYATSVVLANRDDFVEASPWMYGLTSEGQITVQYGPEQSTAVAGASGPTSRWPGSCTARN
jgi:hypothetical protein